MRSQVSIASLVTLACVGAADASYFWGSCAAVQNNASPQSGFLMDFGGIGTMNIQGGGEDPTTNSFANPTKSVMGGGSTTVDFHSGNNATLGQGTTGFFAVYGDTTNPPDLYDCRWSPAGNHVPIVPYLVRVTQSAVEVSVTNTQGTPLSVLASAYDPIQHGPGWVPPIPMMSALTPMSGLEGTYAPGQTRMVSLPLTAPDVVYGFFAQASFASDPDAVAVTWVGSPVPAPSGLLSVGGLAGAMVLRRRR